uniref:Uncharacterized protein n=1 Tax=virus sp. ct1Hk25 TaxID=2825803 RepID=A0A8S5RNV4_9VIRU|nr:MAG TPA: hypothetical protein [virus sp. ct1Hk25]
MPFKVKFFISIYLHLRVYHEHMFVSIAFRTNVLFSVFRCNQTYFGEIDNSAR